jgi:hypothetical protein
MIAAGIAGIAGRELDGAAFLTLSGVNLVLRETFVKLGNNLFYLHLCALLNP